MRYQKLLSASGVTIVVEICVIHYYFVFCMFETFFLSSMMNLCIRARGTTVACANIIKMYPIYKI